MLEAAKVYLKEQGRSIEFLTHRVVTKRERIAHLFRGKEGTKTVRFVGVPGESGNLEHLEEISTSERKWIGKTARTDIEVHRKRPKRARKAGVKQYGGRKVTKKSNNRSRGTGFTPCVLVKLPEGYHEQTKTK